MLAVALAAVVSTNIPFALHDHRVAVQAFVNRAGPFSMIVDTGSGGLLITPETARRTGVKVRSAGSTIVSQLQLATIRYDRTPAVVADLSPT